MEERAQKCVLDAPQSKTAKIRFLTNPYKQYLYCALQTLYCTIAHFNIPVSYAHYTLDDNIKIPINMDKIDLLKCKFKLSQNTRKKFITYKYYFILIRSIFFMIKL